MKKLIVLAVIGILSLSVMGAAPAINEWAAYLGDTLTVDSQHTASVWELVDSIIIIKTDTCRTVYEFSGYVSLNPSAKLYVGFDDGGGKSGAPVDTFIVENPGYSKVFNTYFSFKYLDSLVSQTDENDTIYFYVAKGGSGSGEGVVIKNGILTAEVLDWSAAGMIGE